MRWKAVLVKLNAKCRSYRRAPCFRDKRVASDTSTVTVSDVSSATHRSDGDWGFSLHIASLRTCFNFVLVNCFNFEWLFFIYIFLLKEDKSLKIYCMFIY